MREPGRKGGGRCTEGGRRGGGKRDSQSGGKRGKRENYAKLHNISQLKKRQEAGAIKYRAGTEVNGYGKRDSWVREEEGLNSMTPPPPAQ